MKEIKIHSGAREVKISLWEKRFRLAVAHSKVRESAALADGDGERIRLASRG